MVQGTTQVPLPDKGSSNDASDPLEVAKLAWWKFGGDKTSQGFNLLYFARGPFIFAGIFLSTAILFLASEEAGCLDEDGEEILDEDECRGEVYGFQPGTFVTLITIISGLLSAFFMPIIGAMVDYTNHRRTIGLIASVVLVGLNAGQIAISSKTWLPLAIVEGFSVFIFEVQAVSMYAYLPDIGETAGDENLARFNAIFVACQFGGEIIFMVLVVAVSIALGFDDVGTARAGQVLCIVWGSICFWFCYRLLPDAEARHALPPGRSLVSEGFLRVFRTAREINSEFKHGLRWYLLATVFGDAAISGFMTASVIYLDDKLGYSGTEVGLFFIVSLLATIPGAHFGGYLGNKISPILSWQLSMLTAAVGTWVFIPIFAVASKYAAFGYGMLTGASLGWYFIPQAVFFSRAVPKNQEAELAGFFVYCSLILSWAPATIYAAFLEADISHDYGLMATTLFFVVGALVLTCTGSWDNILLESGRDVEKVTRHANDNSEIEAGSEQD